TGSGDVPLNRPSSQEFNDIPITYVPSRNIIFLSFALSWGETVGSCDIFIGANAVDYSGYPDCRPDFLSAFEEMAKKGTKSGVEGTEIQIHSPLIDLSKKEIVETGVKLGVDFSKTSSCYNPGKSGSACGRCDSCLLRKKGFTQAGLSDPV
ncbi:MAG: 7-cyano-7-deazaguanine synthase, partial [Nitrospinota bacterium]